MSNVQTSIKSLRHKGLGSTLRRRVTASKHQNGEEKVSFIGTNIFLNANLFTRWNFAKLVLKLSNARAVIFKIPNLDY